jgi:Putative F0F1-ATPase subunit Ca2+/Mg2+ transporter
MSQSNPSPEPAKGKFAVNNLAMLSVGAQVGCVTVLIVFLALFAGLGLDNLLGTKPVFTIILILGAAPLSLFLTFKLAMRAVKTVTPQEPVTTQVKPVEEEEHRE